MVLAAFFHHNPGGILAALPRFDQWLRREGWMILAGHARSQSGPNAKGPGNPQLLWDPTEIVQVLELMGYKIAYAADVPRHIPRATNDLLHASMQFPPPVDTIVVASKLNE